MQRRLPSTERRLAQLADPLAQAAQQLLHGNFVAILQHRILFPIRTVHVSSKSADRTRPQLRARRAGRVCEASQARQAHKLDRKALHLDRQRDTTTHHKSEIHGRTPEPSTFVSTSMNG